MISDLRMISGIRMISGRRMISEPFHLILKKTPKKNKIVEIPTKMKEMIGAPEGRLSLPDPRGAISAHDRLSFDDRLSCYDLSVFLYRASNDKRLRMRSGFE